MSEIRYLFIDGGYLRKALQSISRRHFDGEHINIAPRRLAGGFHKSFYYDCLPSQRRDESEEEYSARLAQQEEFFQRLRSHKGMHVTKGVVRGRVARQKQVDVAITVDMLTHSYRRNMDKATLLTGDLDFKPVVEALVRDGMYVTLWYEPQSASDDLIYAADERRELNAKTIYEIADDEFKDRCPQPFVQTRSRDALQEKQEKWEPIATGEAADGREVFLFCHGDYFEMITTKSGNPTRVLVISYGDREFLENYTREGYFDFEWH